MKNLDPLKNSQKLSFLKEKSLEKLHTDKQSKTPEKMLKTDKLTLTEVNSYL